MAPSQSADTNQILLAHRQRVLRILHRASLLALSLAIVNLAINREFSSLWPTAIAWLGVAALTPFERRGALNTAGLILILTTLGMATYICIQGNGLHDVAMLIYPVGLITAALILNFWSFLVINALCFGCVLALGLLTHLGLIHDPVMAAPGRNPVTDTVTTLIILGVGALALRLFASAMHRNAELAWARSQRLEESNQKLASEIRDRLRAEAEVRQLNSDLEHRVRQRTVQLEEANRELEAFAYSVSHDLRAPLRAIQGQAHLILEDHVGQLPPAAVPRLESLAERALSAGRMIDGLLSFSRLGRTSLQRQTVSTRHAVEDVIAELSPSAPTGSATRFELGALPEVHADPVLIRQAFANLISNAVKYSRQHPSPIVRIGSQIQGDQVTVFHIRDNGVGFEMSHAGKLFGVFQRLHAQSEFEGTGIGLALTYRIITRHGGRIWAEAEPGKGATFYFTLPPPPDATPNPP